MRQERKQDTDGNTTGGVHSVDGSGNEDGTGADESGGGDGGGGTGGEELGACAHSRVT